MRDTRFAQFAIFINSAVPLTLLSWDWYHHRLGANPTEFATRTTGVLTLLFLITPRYFDVFQIPIRAGRAVTWQDINRVPMPVVIDEVLAHKLFGDQSPIGQTMMLQIIGKVRLIQTPWINHSWHATLYVTSRGLTTSPIPHGDREFHRRVNAGERTDRHGELRDCEQRRDRRE